MEEDQPVVEFVRFVESGKLETLTLRLKIRGWRLWLVTTFQLVPALPVAVCCYWRLEYVRMLTCCSTICTNSAC